jgi:hypothetical protein
MGFPAAASIGEQQTQKGRRPISCYRSRNGAMEIRGRRESMRHGKRRLCFSL